MDRRTPPRAHAGRRRRAAQTRIAPAASPPPSPGRSISSGVAAATGELGASSRRAAACALRVPDRCIPRLERCVVGIAARPRVRLLLFRRSRRRRRRAGRSCFSSTRCAIARLPALDGLIIGGGFPEMFVRELEPNAALRGDIPPRCDRGRYARVRRVWRGFHVPSPARPAGAATRAAWSARSRATR